MPWNPLVGIANDEPSAAEIVLVSRAAMTAGRLPPLSGWAPAKSAMLTSPLALPASAAQTASLGITCRHDSRAAFYQT